MVGEGKKTYGGILNLAATSKASVPKRSTIRAGGNTVGGAEGEKGVAERRERSEDGE
ncbi:hypothetical protein A2U01_0091399 [Trifolium medium]|uniref:Uncharacterized protein n=1 Tax=Trifolium medium TaxID=97028 RepID=A0A392UCI7_9FABA|nr:hypothetical protein [Trifolium medium]